MWNCHHFWQSNCLDIPSDRTSVREGKIRNISGQSAFIYSKVHFIILIPPPPWIFPCCVRLCSITDLYCTNISCWFCWKSSDLYLHLTSNKNLIIDNIYTVKRSIYLTVDFRSTNSCFKSRTRFLIVPKTFCDIKFGTVNRLGYIYS